MFCKSCGNPTNVNSKFCGKCGVSALADKTIGKRDFDWWKTGGGIVILIIIIASIAFSSWGSGDPILDALHELEPDIQPVGYFDDPELYGSEDISTEEWISHFQYYDTEYSSEGVYNGGTLFINQRNVLRSVVKIICFDSDENISFGSGLNDDEAGYILTNLHVVADAGNVGCMVGFPNPDTGLIVEAYWATPIADDDGENIHDLAYLSVEEPVVDDDFKVYGYVNKITDDSFPYFEQSDFCYYSPINLGDKIFIVGYPYQSGYALTITDGLVSSLYSTSGYIVTSAKIVSGNSGGLAIDENGCYVGVPTAVYGGGEDEFLGEIIDGEFVDEFYDSIEDELDEYISSL